MLDKVNRVDNLASDAAGRATVINAVFGPVKVRAQQAQVAMPYECLQLRRHLRIAFDQVETESGHVRQRCDGGAERVRRSR